jgi:mannose-6-phosphate isomerase
MPSHSLYPLRFEPILKRLIWGGRRLGTTLHKPIGPESDYAESWEVADHRRDVSRVADGPLMGTTLREIIHVRGRELLGPALARHTQFPLLVKFLDAHQKLSVQVHPDDTLGRRLLNDNGKTEVWIVVFAEPGSLIYAGLLPGVTRAGFARALESGTVEPLLHSFHPRRGDSILIPAGTVHAIGAGIVLAEIQQMSDATFRVYDWGRLGQDGKPRPLHVAEALEATDFAGGPVDPLRPLREQIEGGTRERLAECQYFAVDRLRIEGRALVGSFDRFTILLGLDGSARVVHRGARYPLEFGDTLLLPASIGPCAIEPNGHAEVLTCVVPSV